MSIETVDDQRTLLLRILSTLAQEYTPGRGSVLAEIITQIEQGEKVHALLRSDGELNDLLTDMMIFFANGWVQESEGSIQSATEMRGRIATAHDSTFSQ